MVVVGDVNSTMACTLSAPKWESKLRTWKRGCAASIRNMPEEINRIVTDALARPPGDSSPDADENLKREGIAESKIRLVGNVMIDTLVTNLEKARLDRPAAPFEPGEKGFRRPLRARDQGDAAARSPATARLRGVPEDGQ